MTMMTSLVQASNTWMMRWVASPRRKPLPLIDSLMGQTQLAPGQAHRLRLAEPLAILSTDAQDLREELRTAWATLVDRAQALLEEDPFLRWTGTTRQQQLSTMLSDVDAQANQQVHKQANLELGAGVAATVLASVGALGAPALGLLSVP